MALKFLSGGASGGSKDIKYFDIRLDNDYIVFRGGEDEAASAQLAGSLVLCLTEPLNIHHINLTLSGIVHMSYVVASTSSMSGRRTGSKEKTFFEKTWTFKDAGRGKSEVLPRDNYEWPFDIVLSGDLPESVEGLRDAHVIYRLKAEISRKRGKDIVVRKPVRIVRTLGSTALELSHAMSVENVWPNKVEYSISTPSKAVIFGSFLQVDFKLIPLLKGLVIGNIATQLKEEQEIVIDPEWGVNAVNSGHSKEDRIIAYDNYQLNLETDEQIIDETAEGFQFSRYLELPKTLNKCLQDCNVKGIKVRHKIKFNVQLHNPDGHISELRANLPVSLYISPNLPINADNDLVDQSPQAGRAAVANDALHSAPPLYGEHQLDQLYSEVDSSGYRTPGAALSTAATPYSQSRNISSENLASLDALTVSETHVSAAALQHRLQNLRSSDRAIPTHLAAHDESEQPRSGVLSRRSSQPHNNHGSSDYFAQPGTVDAQARTSPHSLGTSPRNGIMNGQNSQPESAVISRQPSAEDQPASGTLTPYAIASDHFEDLAKVPSYSTAVRTPAPRNRGASDKLPTYGAVIRDSSPAALVEPPSAYVRDGSRHGSYAGPEDTNVRPTPFHRGLSIVQDEDRRLGRLRANR